MLCASQTASRVLLGAALVLALASSEVASQALNRNQMANIALKSLNPCERGIWQCCQTDRATLSVPATCFERNGCFGLHWLGAQACSPRMINAVASKLQGVMITLFRQQQGRKRRRR